MAHPLFFLGVGAAAMFLLDPQAGKKRREKLGEQIGAATYQLQHARENIANAREAVVTDARERTHEILDNTRQALQAKRTGNTGPGVPTLADTVSQIIDPWKETHWSPAQRALAGAFGAAAAAYGYLRGGIRGFAWCAVGGAVMARATANEDIAVLADEARRKLGRDNPALPAAGD